LKVTFTVCNNVKPVFLLKILIQWSCGISDDESVCVTNKPYSETHLIILMARCWLVLWSNARMTWPKLPLPITSRISYRYDMWSWRTWKPNSKASRFIPLVTKLSTTYFPKINAFMKRLRSYSSPLLNISILPFMK
jgi:hypothetical protein